MHSKRDILLVVRETLNFEKNLIQYFSSNFNLISKTEPNTSPTTSSTTSSTSSSSTTTSSSSSTSTTTGQCYARLFVVVRPMIDPNG